MNEKQLPVAVERVRTQFESWRAQKHKGERIPEPLWQAAAEAARKHGVNAVSRVVRLEHATLRRRVEELATNGTEPVAFVELGQDTTQSVGCVVELEKSNGARMRICVADGAAVDWARMKEAFLGA